MPPPQPRLTVLLEASEDAQVPEDAIATDLGIWALQRWGLGEVTISGADHARLTALARLLADAGIAAQIDGAVAPPPETSQAPAKDGARTSPRAITATIAVYATSPSRLEAQRAEREAAARAAALEESFSAP